MTESRCRPLPLLLLPPGPDPDPDPGGLTTILLGKVLSDVVVTDSAFPFPLLLASLLARGCLNVDEMCRPRLAPVEDKGNCDGGLAVASLEDALLDRERDLCGGVAVAL